MKNLSICWDKCWDIQFHSKDSDKTNTIEEFPEAKNEKAIQSLIRLY